MRSEPNRGLLQPIKPTRYEKIARSINRAIARIGHSYQSGIGKHINPMFESFFPAVCKNFRGPGRALGTASVTVVLYWGLHLFEPAYALFLEEAQDYVTGLEFFAGADALVNIFFGLLRSIIVIVLGYFVVRIALAVRADEDWQTFVRYPVFIVGAIAITDFLTSFIVS